MRREKNPSGEGAESEKRGGGDDGGILPESSEAEGTWTWLDLDLDLGEMRTATARGI